LLDAWIAVVDLPRLSRATSWQTGEYSSNYPMVLDNARQTLWVVFRGPAKLVAFDAKSGARIASLDSCSDADDLFVDSKRERIYVSCGAGVIDVWGRRGSVYAKLTDVLTVAGARTSLFVPELDRLYVAVRATASERAALWVFRALP
jgi:hypothetical protein